MEQKRYDIINLLLRDKDHVRGIARQLNTNPMAITRIMKTLRAENVVDYREEGKNKTYFLKDTLEAKSYVFSTESFKLTRMLAKYPRLRGIIENLQKDKRVQLVVLFGSYAKGIAKEDSDIDIFIETNDLALKKELALIDTKLSIKIGMLDNSNLLSKEIVKNHVIIKGVELYYEKNPIFN